ncbi:helix-turn-helix domain-containing protein [Ancylomarina sp. 16SWW S1-10-2]|uniref:helix-turn-helix domain-containing protein n=1 Tax=Ancylomarina sp. 16SWW S1-10-2 TaxID=2499681 RepID=UPI0012ADA0CE|nr:helix-turn-helix domain-containing protein [Ancylomarina sp. 16SWW S1-10-2]MRT92609.1 helix-turn-helix domain-containing protein [Ancylomarina sp. 16SWW S1-10-2]
MNNKGELPFHHYTDTYKKVNMMNGCPVLSLDPHFPFAMTRFGIMDDESQTEIPHRHDYYEILFVEEGSGKHIVDYESYEIKTPAFYFLSKGQIHFWRLEKSLKGKIILFPREFLIPPATNLSHEDDLVVFNGLSKASQVCIDENTLPKIQELLANINQEFSDRSESSLSVLRAYMHILLVKLFRIYAKEQPINILDPSNTMVRKFRQLVSENYLKVRNVQEYADLIGISSTHLRDTVKAITGYSPGQLIRQEIIFEAKRRLANTDLTTAEIGYALSFEDTSYFSRFFKRETEISPLSYRKTIREKYKIKTI